MAMIYATKSVIMPNKRFKSINFEKESKETMLVNFRMQEVAMAGGLDSKFAGPGPA